MPIALADSKSMPGAPQPHVLEIDVLGPTRLRRDGEAVSSSDWRRQRVRSLLLLMVDRREARRETLSATLWPDFDQDAASRNLRTTLYYLNRTLEPWRSRGQPTQFIKQDGTNLRLTSQDVRVDAWEFVNLLDQAEAKEGKGRVEQAIELALKALRLWRGDYLADATYEHWAMAEQDLLKSRFTATAMRCGRLALESSRPEEAVSLATMAIETDQWSEPAYRMLTLAHLARRDRAAAMRALGRCQAMLDDLGVPPEEKTTKLLDGVRGPRPMSVLESFDLREI